mmetsp:Transcript_26576/g.92367  ORF Transcript_26576/g.92367 Transcript_26576/m.92367 type:complete len:419 (+) Transcript_26576:476-1732(+)
MEAREGARHRPRRALAARQLGGADDALRAVSVPSCVQPAPHGAALDARARRDRRRRRAAPAAHRAAVAVLGALLARGGRPARVLPRHCTQHAARGGGCRHRLWRDQDAELGPPGRGRQGGGLVRVARAARRRLRPPQRREARLAHVAGRGLVARRLGRPMGGERRGQRGGRRRQHERGGGAPAPEPGRLVLFDAAAGSDVRHARLGVPPGRLRRLVCYAGSGVVGRQRRRRHAVAGRRRRPVRQQPPRQRRCAVHAWDARLQRLCRPDHRPPRRPVIRLGRRRHDDGRRPHGQEHPAALGRCGHVGAPGRAPRQLEQPARRRARRRLGRAEARHRPRAARGRRGDRRRRAARDAHRVDAADEGPGRGRRARAPRVVRRGGRVRRRRRRRRQRRRRRVSGERQGVGPQDVAAGARSDRD